MTVRKRKKETLSERLHPGDPEPDWCSPGSIEQKLDMCETGRLRGDDILHSHGVEAVEYNGNPLEMDQVMNQNWGMDLSEVDREGDEMSGDEHSSGLAGSESELEGQPNIATGLPGDLTKRQEMEAQSDALFHPEETEIQSAGGDKVIPITKKRFQNSENSSFISRVAEPSNLHYFQNLP